MALDLCMEELKIVTRPALRVSLSKMGVHYCISATVGEGPHKHLGKGLMSPYHTQGIRRILAIMEQLWHKTPTGDLITSNLDVVAEDVGIFGTMFDPSAKQAFSWAITPKTGIITSIL